MSLQVSIFLLLFGGVQGLLLLLFFLHKKLFRSGYIFLLLYLGVLLLQLTLKVMSKIWLMQNWPVNYMFSHYLPLLYGPLVFLFVKYNFNSRRFSKKDLLHFIPPAVAYALVFIAENNLVTPNPFFHFIFMPEVRLFLLCTSLIIYHLPAYQLWKQHRKQMKSYFSDEASLQFNWVKQFIYISAAAGIIVAGSLYFLYITYPVTHQYRFGFVALSIIIYWFSYTALTRPSVFSVIRGNATAETIELSLPPLKLLKQNPKYSNSALGNEEAQQIVAKVGKLMTDEKLYLQPTLTITQLAEALHCSRHHLSQVLNDKLNQSYNDYINNLRIEEAKALLLNEKNSQLKIASIAYDAGFNSLSTFNEVFKKFTGKTPSDFRKDSLKELQKQRV